MFGWYSLCYVSVEGLDLAPSFTPAGMCLHATSAGRYNEADEANVLPS
jgi:hypothetical protein